MLHEVTDATFEQDVINSPIPVIVDFMADWCGPCQMLAPMLKEVAPQVADKVKIVKMNIDENPRTPAALGIRSIPTLIMYVNGEIHSSYREVISKTKLQEWVQSV